MNIPNSVSALDVAAYILRQKGEMTAMKLQKLVYYCQAWSLVWDEAPLFSERIEAWANGPVVRELYESHRGLFYVDSIQGGNPDKLEARQKETIDSVLSYYGNRSAQWLSELTHAEDPWRIARERDGLAPMERGSAEITWADMDEYYGSL